MRSAARDFCTPRAVALAGVLACLSTLYVFRGASDAEGLLKDEGEPGRVPPEPELKTLVVKVQNGILKSF